MDWTSRISCVHIGQYYYYYLLFLDIIYKKNKTFKYKIWPVWIVVLLNLYFLD